MGSRDRTLKPAAASEPAEPAGAIDRRSSITSRLDRRDWMKRAAAVAGATAAGSLVAVTEVLAVNPPAPAAPAAAPGEASAVSATTTVIASGGKAIVETASGNVRGFTRNGISTFKGMPYGGPTDGKNRFMPPTKPASWTGVRSSLFWGPVSPQAFTNTSDARRAGWGHDEEAFMFEWDDGQPSEDCLRINVWTPSTVASTGKRPVLIWIHGGGYSSGSDNELRMYDGENLARRGNVVVVSLNHRLGVLGYLNLLDYGSKWVNAANVGQLDIVAALGWVKENIGNFGGDPSKVLVFGQSGGGGKISTLMGMPSAKGLFHRAVIESGSSVRQLTPDRSGRIAKATLDELGLTGATLDKLQDLPVDAVVQAGVRGVKKAQGGVVAAPGTGGLNWGPTVDGSSLPRHAWDPAAPDESAGVPLLVGSVLNEFGNSIQGADPSLDTMSMDDMRTRLTAQRGAKTDDIIRVFQQAHPKATPADIFSLVTGMTARMNVVQQASLKAAQKGAPAYVYWFQWQTPVLDGRPRAYHCSELPFVFYNTDRCAAMTGGGAGPKALAGKIADAWINFARAGDPNHAGLPKWAPFSAATCPTMVFDTVCALKNDPDKALRGVLG